MLRRDLARLNAVIMEIATSGTASASLSSGGGSKSYTRMDLGSLRALYAEKAERLGVINSALGGSPSGIRRIMTVRY